MKTLKIENNLIKVIFEFLRMIDLSSNRTASRGRSQLLKRLEEKNTELIENQDEIRKEYFVLDEQGQFKVQEDGQTLIFLDGLTHTDIQQLDRDLFDLQREKFEINFGEHSSQYEMLFSALEDEETDFGVELSGDNAVAYNELMDAYERNEVGDK